MALTPIEERVKKYKDLYQPQAQEQINAVNQTATQQKATVQDMYNSEINKTKQSYEDENQRNLVQKYVNEQQIAENMSNLGLTDSGLNRTQQTAAQLSYSNNRSKIDRQLQSAVDAFVQNMNSKLTDIETSRIGSEASIKQSYDNAALSAAQDEYKVEYDNEAAKYKANMDAQADIIKSQISAASKAKTAPTLYRVQSSDVTPGNDNKTYDGMYTFTGNDGKTYKYAAGINPYTGSNNNSTTSVKKYGVFESNGYQPKGIYKTDEKGKVLYDSGKLTAVDRTNIFGVEQNVYKDKNGNHWVWNGKANEYQNVSG